MLITMEMLCQKDACEEGKALFAKLFGESVEYSTELHQKLFQLHPEFEAWLIEQAIIMPLHLQVGNGQQLHVGYCGTATAGDRGTATAGDFGTATVGYRGTATAGDYGTATAGRGGTATAGFRGKVKAGLKSEIRIRYWDKVNSCSRTQCGFIDGAILKADVFYKLDTQQNFILAE